MKLFQWERGRKNSGYDKMLLLTGMWPIPFDCYLIRYPEGSQIKPHTDPVQVGRHFRLNIVLKEADVGGVFICDNPIFSSRWLNIFRPDVSEHRVTQVIFGSRYIFSIGWVLK